MTLHCKVDTATVQKLKIFFTKLYKHMLPAQWTIQLNQATTMPACAVSNCQLEIAWVILCCDSCIVLLMKSKHTLLHTTPWESAFPSRHFLSRRTRTIVQSFTPGITRKPKRKSPIRPSTGKRLLDRQLSRKVCAES